MPDVEALPGAVDPPAARSRFDPRSWRLSGLTLFASSPDAPRARRPSDIVLVVVGVVVLVAVALLAPGPTELGADVARLLQATPLLFGWLWEVGYDLLPLWALVLLLATAIARGRRRLLVDQLLAPVLTFAVALLVGFAGGSSVSQMWHQLVSSTPPGAFPAMRLAVFSSVVAVTSPHLIRPVRLVGRWLIGLCTLSVVALGLTSTLGALAGLACGVACAAAVHLLLGSPGGRPPLDELTAELADLGFAVTDLHEAALQRRGVALSTARGPSGEPVLVKVYGRDAWEGQLISSSWSRLWYRTESPSTRVGRLQQVEHEAFATLLAERAGVAVMPVVVAGLAWERDAVLVTAADATPAARLAPEAVGDELLAGWWRVLGSLHAAGVSHGGLNTYSILARDDGASALTNLAGASTSPSPAQLATDRAQLLVATALVVGPDRAVAAAVAATDTDQLTALLPYLQPAVLDLETRHSVRAADWGMGDLRSAAAAAAGGQPPKLEQLHRVSVRSLVLLGVIALVAYAVISAISGIGLSTLVEEFQSADKSWVLLALLLSPLIPVGTSVATLGASTREVRFGPVLALQYAIQFIALAVPSTAARIALEIRFFERFGVAPTGAVAIGLIDSFSGFLVQIALVLVILLSGLATLQLSGGEPSSGSTSTTDTGSSGIDAALVLAIVTVLVLVVAVVLVAVPRLRRFVRARAADARVALQVVRSPRKVSLLLSGNLTAQLLSAAALAACVEAFGYHVPFAAAVLVNTAAALFGGLMPVPGGVGVVEGALTAGLVAVGVPQAPALSAALMFRIVTFYIPPLWGGFAMRWLRRHEYV